LLGGSATGAQGQTTEKTAGETYKNVKVLTSVSASTFMNTMFFQRYSLGVSCTHCHVAGKWESDEKPAKLRAREMLRMVLDLNRTQFEGKPVVNCMTCHRGSVTPIRDITANRLDLDKMLRPHASASERPSATLPAPTEVLSRYVTAIGGHDAFARIRNTAIKGQLLTTEGMVVPFEDTYASGPDRWLSVRHFGGTLGDFSTGFDGTDGWNRDNRGLTPQAGERLAALAMTAALENRSNIAELYSGWKTAGTEIVDGAEVVVLTAVSTFTHQAERLYFDVTTGLLTRRSVVTESVFGSFATDTYFEGYRAIDGIQFPTMVSQFTPDFGTVRKIASIETNVDLNPAVFARP